MPADPLTRRVAWTVGAASLTVLVGAVVIAAGSLRGGPARAGAWTDHLDDVALPPGDATLGGARVGADRLARGARLYRRYCATCHGARGDGLGPSAPFMSPPPRDFTAAQFKYTGTPEGALPHDDDLSRVVRGGLRGTAMQRWDLPDAELGPILDVIKAFSPPGRGFRDPSRRPERAEVPPDPFAGAAARAAAVAEGARLYHGDFQCNQCHPSYASREELASWGATARADAPGDPVPKWSASYRSVLLPPDFLRHPMRSIRDESDLYRVIANGMSGPMPAYGHLGARQVWAVAHYTAWVAGSGLSARGGRASGRR